MRLNHDFLVEKKCSSPEPVDRPGVIGTQCGVHIPELGLEHLAARVVEATGILTMILGLTADVGQRT